MDEEPMDYEPRGLSRCPSCDGPLGDHAIACGAQGIICGECHESCTRRSCLV